MSEAMKTIQEMVCQADTAKTLSGWVVQNENILKTSAL